MSCVLQLVQAPISERKTIFTPREPTVITPSVLDPCTKIKLKSHAPITEKYRREDVMLLWQWYITIRTFGTIAYILFLDDQAEHKPLPQNLVSTHVIPVRPFLSCSKIPDGVSSKISVKSAVLSRTSQPIG